MLAFISENETAVRLAVFAGAFAILIVAESLAPRRLRVLPRGHRWLTNLTITALNTVLLRFVFTAVAMPLMAVGTALVATQHGFGLLNWITAPIWLKILAGIVLLDVLIYGQHVAFHRIPLFWRFHRVHHADRDIDATTGFRFHPVEILLSMVIKIAAVAAIGAPAVAVVLFEVILNGMAMFNHANLRLPTTIDTALRALLVTPDMHRVHHSVVIEETNSNFGFNLSIWDRMFGTYRAQPGRGHIDMEIGLPEYRDSAPAHLGFSLLLPFHTENDAKKAHP